MHDEPIPLPAPEAEPVEPDRAAAPVLTVLAAILCGACFGLFHLQPAIVHELLAPGDYAIWEGAWWGLLSSTFVHIQPLHLLCNLSFVLSLGLVVERRLGHLGALALLVGSSLVASGAQLGIVGQTGIGISGVVYAWAGFAWAARGRDPVLRQAIEGQAAWLAGWLVLCFVLTKTGTLNVGNAAHVGGLVFGLLTGTWWARARTPSPATSGLIAASAVLVVASTVPIVWAPWSARWQFSRAPTTCP
jgi:membrane associated rhomboid family serine protease